MITIISRDAVRARIANNPGLVILEALPERHFEQGHLPGALNMPHDRVAELAPALAPDPNGEVIVYCANASCQHSHIAAQRLAALGYARVSVYAGGKQDWTAAGLPLSEPANA